MKIFHHALCNKTCQDIWSILAAFSRGFYVHSSILKVEKPLGKRLEPLQNTLGGGTLYIFWVGVCRCWDSETLTLYQTMFS